MKFYRLASGFPTKSGSLLPTKRGRELPTLTEIKRILNKYKLESNQRRKVNTIRKNAGLEEIDVKTLDKEL